MADFLSGLFGGGSLASSSQQQQSTAVLQPTMSKDYGTDQKNLPTVAASEALAAAIARGGSSSMKIEPKGCWLDAVTPQTFNVDSVKPSDVQQLRVMAITKLKTDYREKVLNQVASNASYICYAIAKNAQIRVLSKETASKALLKGHTGTITDMQFSTGLNVLASCDDMGEVHVRTISDVSDQQLQEELLVKKSFGANHMATRRLAWHPQLENLLAVAGNDCISFVNVPPTLGVASFPEFSEPVTPTEPQTTATFTCLAFSPKGEMLAASDSNGDVHVWHLPPDFCTKPKYEALSVTADCVFKAYSSDDGSSYASCLDFLYDHHNTFLVTGDACSKQIKLWAIKLTQTDPVPDAANGEADKPDISVQCTYELQLTSNDGGNDIFNHLVVQPEFNAVILANTKKQQVYVLHARLASVVDTARFDYVSVFSVMMPILSISAGCDSSVQDVGGQQAFRLYAVQTEAVQEYTLYPAACFPGTEMGERHSVPGTEAPASGSQHVHLPQPQVPPTVHMPQLAEPTAGPSGSSVGSQPSEVLPSQQPQTVQAVEEPALVQPEVAAPAAGLEQEQQVEVPPADQQPEVVAQPAQGVEEEPQQPQPDVAARQLGQARLPERQLFGVGIEGEGAAQVAGSPAAVLLSITPRMSQEGALPCKSPDDHSDTEAVPTETAEAKSEATGTIDVVPSLLEGHFAVPPPPQLAFGMLQAARRPGSASGAEGSESLARSKLAAVPQQTDVSLLFGGPLQGKNGSRNSLDSDATSPAPKLVQPDEFTTTITNPAFLQVPIVPEPSNGTAMANETSSLETGEALQAGGSSITPDSASRKRTRRNDRQKGAAAAAAAPSPVTAAPPPPIPSPQLLRRSSQPMAASSAVDSQQASLVSQPQPATTQVGTQAQTFTSTGPSVSLEQLTSQLASHHKDLLKQVKAELKTATKATDAALKQQRDRDEAATAAAITALRTQVQDMQRALPTQLAVSLAPLLKASLSEALPNAAQQAVDKAVRAAVPRAVTEALTDCFTSSVIPAIERATAAMFGQMQSALDSSLSQYTAMAAEAGDSLKTAQTEFGKLSTALQAQLAALNKAQAAAGLASRQAPAAVLPAAPAQPVSKSTLETLQDHLAARQYEAAFVLALSSSDREHLSWLLKHVDPSKVLGSPPLLGQGIILSLLSHLTVSLDTDIEHKLQWVTEAASALDSSDKQTRSHGRMVLEPLKRAVAALATSGMGEPARLAKTCVHIINSLLHIMAEQP